MFVPFTPLFPGFHLPKGFTLYATVYGSWNTILPVGQEIVRIDVMVGEDNGYTTDITRFAWDAGTPLPLVFHPDGTLYYAMFGGGGRCYTIDAKATTLMQFQPDPGPVRGMDRFTRLSEGANVASDGVVGLLKVHCITAPFQLGFWCGLRAQLQIPRTTPNNRFHRPIGLAGTRVRVRPCSLSRW